MKAKAKQEIATTDLALKLITGLAVASVASMGALSAYLQLNKERVIELRASDWTCIKHYDREQFDGETWRGVDQCSTYQLNRAAH